MLNKILWALKQLLPLKYHTTYGRDGAQYVSVWRMWFGRCFSIEEWQVVGDV